MLGSTARRVNEQLAPLSHRPPLNILNEVKDLSS
jgi:hypothetical protein